MATRVLLPALAGLVPLMTSKPVVGQGYVNITGAPCFIDNTGLVDVTAALNKCILAAYHISIPSTPLFFPSGRYLVSDTIVFPQALAGGDDGINVVPGRFLPLIAFGAATGLPNRPTLVLAPGSPGFGDAGAPKPVVQLLQAGGCGEGCDMNNVFKGVDVDITAAGNPGAAGVSHNGAQGSVVTDVTVRASDDAYACFLGCNGAGGGHHGVTCLGGRYGFVISGAQPVPSIVGAQLVNQSVSAIVFESQETLSLVGSTIVQASGATGPAITATANGMSIIDVRIDCGGGGSFGVGIATDASLYLRDTYVAGCTAAAVNQSSLPALPAAPSGQWLHVGEWAKGVDPAPYFHSDVVYTGGVRTDGGRVLAVETLGAGQAPPPDLLSRHMWDEESFPSVDTASTADARSDCGAVGDDTTDDTAALQACLSTHTRVFLPPGMYRISSTLLMQPGGALVGMGNGASYILAASGGFPAASPSSPQPLLRTAEDDEGAGVARPTTLAFLGLVTWQHLADVFTLDWRSQHPSSVWRVNFESRNCECLWLSAYQLVNGQSQYPCAQPVNTTITKTVFRGLGRVYNFVNDDTGAILSTSATYRSMGVYNTSAFATAAARLRFYSLNLEHSQSEALSEVRNATWVDMYSVKSEGNLPAVWVRSPSANVSILGLGGGLTAFAFNYTYPPDFTPALPSYFRVDAGTTGVKLALLQDHGYGAEPPFWPPVSGTCHWKHEYPYPGEAVPAYPFGTWPNLTMWNCWYGQRVATAYWHMIAEGDGVGGWTGTSFYDKPVYWVN